MHLVTFERRASDDGRRPAEGERVGAMGDAALGLESLDSLTVGARRLGAVLGEGSHAGDVVDLNRALAIKLACDDVGAPEAEADSLLPTDARVFLRRLPGSLDSARAALDFVQDALERYDAPDVLRAGVVEARARVRLCAPVPRPGKIVGVVGHYPAAGGAGGGEPVLFLKAPSAVIGPEDEIRLPEAGGQVDFEGELAVVIGLPARRVGEGAALSHVAGYCAANDLSVRGYRQAGGQHFIGSSCDGFAPLGPALVTADEIPDPQALAIRSAVSGEPMQSGRTKEMPFPVARIVAFASRLMTLEPGDVLLCGAPAGAGESRVPPRYLRDGDLVEVEVEGVGRLRNYVRGSATGW